MGYSCYQKDVRDQGYGVPAECDHPDCTTQIHRGIAHSCGGDPTENCGLFFCTKHRKYDVDSEADFTPDNRHTFGVCARCATGAPQFVAKPDIPEWIEHKMTDPSWADWRTENPEWVSIHSEPTNTGDA